MGTVPLKLVDNEWIRTEESVLTTLFENNSITLKTNNCVIDNAWQYQNQPPNQLV